MNSRKKELSLNYHSCFGEEEAIKRYYETGVLSAGNFKGMGKSHLVKVSDMVDYLKSSIDPKDHEWAKSWEHYSTEEDTRHFYDTFRLKNRQERIAKHFNHKLWAVEMIKEDTEVYIQPVAISILLFLIKIIVYPTKFIPSRRVLVMDKYNYKVVTYRIGDVINGYSIDIHIPKKFSFR